MKPPARGPSGSWLLMVTLAALCTSGCGMQLITAHGRSMAPALGDGERALAIRDIDHLERGQIVTFHYPIDPSRNFVQRIVGLPGERLTIEAGTVMIDGRPLDEPYVSTENRSSDSFGPMVLPADAYFVMGDNRKNSSDSRSWGTVRRDLIWARVAFE